MLKKLSLILIGLLLGSNVALSANYVDCDSAMNAGKPFILYLHSNTCGSCKRFTPIFNSVVQDMPYNVVDINYSYSQSRNVCTTAETKTIPAGCVEIEISKLLKGQYDPCNEKTSLDETLQGLVQLTSNIKFKYKDT